MTSASLPMNLRSLLGVTGLRFIASRWRLGTRAAATQAAARPRLLILPSDPWTLTGAKGDEAMMRSVIAPLAERHPGLEVGIVTATPQAERAAAALGATPIAAWSARFSQDFERMRAFRPDRAVILGADILDGYYGPQVAARLLLLADALARRGVKVALLGFSFNASPSRWLRPLFDRLHPDVAVNVRDRVSHERFGRFSRRPARLVADAAFLLRPAEPAPALRAVADWAAARRAAGDAVLGFNLHPMLLRPADAAQVEALTRTAAEALRRVAARRAASFMLISHDYRGAQSDDACLAPLHRALQAELGERLLYRSEPFAAAELKTIGGEMDAVVTGRMHLAIATLGMGRPVAALTYQDKFQGLFEHFGYPDRYLLAPRDLDAGSLAGMMEALIDDLPALAARVAERLPAVLQAARRNVETLL